MASFAIDDDFSVVREARSIGWRVTTGLVMLLGTAMVAGGIVGAINGSPWWLVAAPVGGFVLLDLRLALRSLAHARGIDIATPARISTTITGLSIEHPVLERALDLPWSVLRAFDVEKPVVHRFKRMRPRYELFRIAREPGSLHPLSEPVVFLGTGDDKEPVALASIDLCQRLPNVAILFTEPQPLTLHAPAAAGDRGWPPPVWPGAGGRQLLSEGVAHLERVTRTIDTPGIYIRTLEQDTLARVLAAQGVRRGFTCPDWVYATGADHREYRRREPDA